MTLEQGIGGGPGAGSAALSPKALLAAVRRRWRSAAAVGVVVAAAAAAAAWHYYPPLYYAAAVAVVSPPEPSPLEPRNKPDREELDAFQRSQVALAKSRAVLREALKRPDVRDTQTVRTAPDPAGLLERRLQVGFQDGSELLRFAMTDTRPDDLAPILNAVKEAYLREAREARKKQLEGRIAEIGDLVGKTEERMMKLRDELKRLAGGPGPTPTELAAYSALAQENVRVQGELRRLAGAIVLYREKLAGAEKYVPAESAIDEAAAADPLVARCRQDVLDLEAEIARRGELTADPKDATGVKLTAALEKAKKAAADAAATCKERTVAALKRKVKETAAQNLAAAEENHEILTRSEKQLKKDLDAGTPTPSRAGDAIDQKRLEIAQAEGALRSLRDVQERLLIENLTTPRNLGTFPGGDAEPPAEPDRAAHVKRIGTWGAAAFVLGVLLVGGWELLAQRLTNRDDVSKALGLRVIGDIPHVVRSHRVGQAFDTSAAGFATALNSLRAVLFLGSNDTASPVRVVLITSAISGEGKTTLAYNLACAVGRANLRVLLVDGDVYRPRLHDVLGLPLGPGLGDVVNGTETLDGAVRPTPFRGLSLLPAGACGAASSDLLHGARAEKLFQEFRAKWDVVIIDGPPVLATADPILLGRHADAALVAVRVGVSVAPQVRSACQMLTDAGVSVLGAVLNGTASRPQYYYSDRPLKPNDPAGPRQTTASTEGDGAP